MGPAIPQLCANPESRVAACNSISRAPAARRRRLRYILGRVSLKLYPAHSPFVQLELVNDWRGGCPGDLHPHVTGAHRLESDLLVKHSHGPVVECVLLRRTGSPAVHIDDMLPLCSRFDVDLESMNVRQLSLVPALEQDRLADAPHAREIELEPWLFRLAVGFPGCAPASVGSESVSRRISIRGAHGHIAIHGRLAKGSDLLRRAIHFQYYDGGGRLHVVRAGCSPLPQRRSVTLAHRRRSACTSARCPRARQAASEMSASDRRRAGRSACPGTWFRRHSCAGTDLPSYRTRWPHSARATRSSHGACRPGPGQSDLIAAGSLQAGNSRLRMRT